MLGMLHVDILCFQIFKFQIHAFITEAKGTHRPPSYLVALFGLAPELFNYPHQRIAMCT